MHNYYEHFHRIRHKYYGINNHSLVGALTRVEKINLNENNKVMKKYADDAAAAACFWHK